LRQECLNLFFNRIEVTLQGGCGLFASLQFLERLPELLIPKVQQLPQNSLGQDQPRNAMQHLRRSVRST
jgi:hypothetical protein